VAEALPALMFPKSWVIFVGDPGGRLPLVPVGVEAPLGLGPLSLACLMGDICG